MRRRAAKRRLGARLLESRGLLAIAVLTLPALALWAAEMPLGQRLDGAAATSKSLANITALLGTGGFAVNVLIGARLPGAEACFGAFDRMYRLHRAVGVAVPLLLLGHAGFLAAHQALNSLPTFALFLPGAGWAVFVGVVALGCLLAGVALSVGARMHHDTFVRVQRALGLAFLAGALHTFALPDKLDNAPTRYLLALCALATLGLAYRVAHGGRLVRRRPHELVGVTRVGPDVAELVLRPLAAPLLHRPGQIAFFTFATPGSDRRPHAFSITSAPGEPCLRIVVKGLGDTTWALVAAPPAGRVGVEGPYGRFSHLEVANPNQIWIAGGIGITPFLGMARSLDAAGRQIDLYYCTEGAEHAYFLDELFAIADRDLRFRVIPIRTRSLGRISASDIVGVSPDLASRDLLICGPPAMLGNLSRQLRAIGVPRARIHAEGFGAP